MTEPEAVAVAGYVPDLMDRSKIVNAIDGIKVISKIDEVAAWPATSFVIDGTREEAWPVIDQLDAMNKNVVVFVGHLLIPKLAKRGWSANVHVLARSAFFSNPHRHLI